MRGYHRMPWQYRWDYTGPKLFDPRSAITRHINWERSKISNHPNHTLNSLPEPDNYTHAIFDSRCHFIPEVNHQLWFHWELLDGYCSVFITTDDVMDQYLINHTPIAWCRLPNVKPIRQRISRIDYERHRNWRKTMCNDLTLEERLHDLGFFQDLIEKGAPEDFIRIHAGWYTPGQYDFDEEENKEELAE